MKTRTLTHLAYLITIAIKGIYGGIEALLGLLIAVGGLDRFYAAVMHFTTPELDEPPSRALTLVRHGAAGLAHASPHFVIFYLLVHGVLKIAIAYNLLRAKRWAFAPSSVILAGFVLYMGYHIARHFSGWLLGFALFDLMTLLLVLNEWAASPRRRQAI